MPIGAIIGAAASVGGALLSSSSTKKAANTAANAQITAARETNALARDLYGRNTENFAPFMASGRRANSTIDGLLYGGPGANAGFDQFRNSTGYQFRLNEGQNALNSGWAGIGALQSGAAARDAIRYGQNFASGEFGNYLGALQGQQALGAGAASSLAGVGNDFLSSVTANNRMSADAQSNAALLRNQANQQLYGSLANAIGGFASSFGK